MYEQDFEELRKNGKKAMREWHHRSMPLSSVSHLIPTSDNGFKLSFKEIEDAFPEITLSMFNSPQDPLYHNEGDVWTHTKMVMEEMFNSDFYQNADVNGQNILFWSVFLHDVSKPITVDFDPDKGRITNANHSPKGENDTRFFMWKNEFPKEMRESVSRIIRYHQKPFHWHKEMSKFDLHKWSQDLPLDFLIAMARADAKGRRYLNDSDKNIAKTLENLYFMEQLAIEEGCLSTSWDHPFESEIARKIYFDAGGTSYVDRPVVDELNGSEVIFLSGLPASGKNYWVKKYGKGLPVLSYDDMREDLGLKQGKDGQAVQLFKETMKKYLAKHQPFILNATHINENLRGKNLALLKKYNATIRIVHLENNYKTLVSRNDQREDNIKNNVIIGMAHNWNPPSSLEAHEVMWWDMKKNTPIYHDFLTSKKLRSPKIWTF